jgi:hypothetical protein
MGETQMLFSHGGEKCSLMREKTNASLEFVFFPKGAEVQQHIPMI